MLETLLTTQQPWATQWPFLRPGICMTYLGVHTLVLLDEDIMPSGVDDFLREMERALKSAPDDFRGASVFHVRPSRWWQGLGIGARIDVFKAFGAVTARHIDKLRRNLMANITIMSSPLTRAFVRTLDAVRTPPAPTRAVASAEEAWTALHAFDPAIDVTQYLAAHAALVERYAPGLKANVYRARR